MPLRSMYSVAVASIFPLLLNLGSAQQCVVVPYPAASEGFEYAANFTQMGNCNIEDFK